MGLAEKLQALPPSVAGLPCGVAKVLFSLEQTDREALEAVMAIRSVPGSTISNRQIHEILISEGHDIAFASIRLHRSKQCRCFVSKEIRQQRIAERAAAYKDAPTKTTTRKTASRKKKTNNK